MGGSLPIRIGGNSGSSCESLDISVVGIKQSSARLMYKFDSREAAVIDDLRCLVTLLGGAGGL